MIESQRFYEALTAHGVTFFTGVPDSLLKEFCAFIVDTVPPARHVIAANEGAALALAAGIHLGTNSIPMVYLQNSGLGNLINPLLSLADPHVYGIPMVLLVGWRGEPGTHDEPQHMVQGRTQEDVFRALGVPYRVIGPADDPDGITRWAVQEARTRPGPVVLAVRKGTFALMPGKAEAAESYPKREDAIDAVLDAAGASAIVVSTTGMASREVFECRERRGEGHGRDFLTVGSMGHASQIALGIALARPERAVWCIDGDGATLMHMGSLAIIGSIAPKNLIHVVLNNGAHDSVGGQPTVGRVVGLAEIARACRYARVDLVKEIKEFQQLVAGHVPGGPWFIEMWVRKGARKDLGRPTSTPVENKRALQAFIAGSLPS
jgi:phosphonopyruvate decarboxylase